MAAVAIIGTGVIGRAWAIVFARAGHEARLYDPDPRMVDRALEVIESNLRDLEAAGLIASAADVGARLTLAATVEAALDGAVYAQESAPEDRDIKHRVFAEMDEAAAPGTILGSSCSAIPGSEFLDVKGRARCLISHPVSPPYLVPLVEVVPTPWTARETVERTCALMEEAGQVPVVIGREIYGFALNRLQAAVVNEALYLVETGVVSPEDLDKTMRHGLGLRWSFMGPFETMDLNADGGFADYAEKYGDAYETMGRDLQGARPWSPDTLDRITRARRARVPAEDIARRQTWRDRRLMALLRHKAACAGDIGD